MFAYSVLFQDKVVNGTALHKYLLEKNPKKNSFYFTRSFSLFSFTNSLSCIRKTLEQIYKIFKSSPIDSVQAVMDNLISQLLFVIPSPNYRSDSCFDVEFNLQKEMETIKSASNSPKGDSKNYNLQFSTLSDIPLNILFNTLTPRQIIFLIQLLLTEQKILIIGSDLNKITSICESLISLIIPF